MPDNKKVFEGINPKEDEEFTEEMVTELSNGRGDDEDVD